MKKEALMMRQYEILNKCLRELAGSNIQTARKLRLEVLFIQTKLALLKSEVESRLYCDAASEQEFLGIYDSLRRVCGSYCAEETDQLIHRMEKLKEDLNSSAEAKETVAPVPKRSGVFCGLLQGLARKSQESSGARR
jgi:hypothetical protein